MTNDYDTPPYDRMPSEDEQEQLEWLRDAKQEYDPERKSDDEEIDNENLN